MVYGIVQQSGGGIDVETAPGAGTTFRIALPTTDRAEARPAAPAAAAVGGSETVLVVEDESALRLLTRRVLVNAGYDVLMAEDADEARRLFTQRADVKLLLTDVVMPRVDGPELAAHLERERPGLRVLYVSGYSSDAVTQRASLAPGIELVQKPFTAEALLSSVRRVLDAPHRPPRPG
jgi:DNA-binding NtrC family response regulator